MSKETLMSGFPPAEKDRVTLANWREPVFNRWAFRHVRELVPNAPILHDPATVSSLPAASWTPEILGMSAGEPGLTLAGLLSATESDGFIVLQDGETLCEWYDDAGGADELHIVFSVSKSITAILAGVLVGEGRLDPDAPVVDILPEAAGSAYGDCSVRHVLDMTVGIDFEESYLDRSGNFVRYREATNWNPLSDPQNPPDLRSFILSLQRDGNAHGEKFHYVSPNSDLLGWIVERVSGRRFHELFSEKIWQPMGAEAEGYITVDRLGAPRAAGGICIRLRDLARFGEMVRNGGAANGRQVVPEAWIADIRKGGDRTAWDLGDLADFLPGGSYRNKWYMIGRGSEAFCAIGIHGQWIYIDPVARLTVVRSASQALPIDERADSGWVRGFAALSASLG